MKLGRSASNKAITLVTIDRINRLLEEAIQELESGNKEKAVNNIKQAKIKVSMFTEVNRDVLKS